MNPRIYLSPERSPRVDTLGKWFDLPDFRTAIELFDEAFSYFARLGIKPSDTLVARHYANMPEFGWHPKLPELNAYMIQMHYCLTTCNTVEPLNLFVELGGPPEDFQLYYVGHFRSRREFARHL